MNKLNKNGAAEADKKEPKNHYEAAWQTIVELNDEAALSMDCYREIHARIFEKVDQLERADEMRQGWCG